MFERLKYLYTIGKITVQHLENAVLKGIITEQQKNLILGE